ncbi:MSP (Major sperm protein) domain family protein [Acanthocheilonema viteae]
MGVFVTVEVLLSFVVLPLVVTLATLVSCGNSRPKHQVNVASNSLRGPVKIRNNKSGSQKEMKRSSETQKTRSTESQSAKSFSKSRKQRSIPLKKSSDASKKSNDHRDLKMEPVELHWNTTGGIRQVFISNPTPIRRAIKVKCSDNSMYRVNPVYSFIDPGQILVIDILRQNGGAKVDKMVFVAATAKKEDINPRTVFQDNSPKPMMVLPLIATNN